MSDLQNVMSDSGNETKKTGSPSKTQIVFWDQPQAKGYGADAASDIAEAYNLANGDGTLRSTFDNATVDEDHSWEDVHQFVAEILVGVNSAVFEGSAADVMDTLMLSGDDLVEYMDEKPEVKQSVVQTLNEQAKARRDSDEEAEADD